METNNDKTLLAIIIATALLCMLFLFALVGCSGDDQPTATPTQQTTQQEPATTEPAPTQQQPTQTPVTQPPAPQPTAPAPTVPNQPAPTQPVPTQPTPTQPTTPPSSPPAAPLPPQPILVPLSFFGVMTNGTAEGTFSYDLNAEPIEVNRRNLQNAIYRVSTFDFVVTRTTQEPLPSASFSSTQVGVTADLCVGTCLASPTRMVILTIRDASGFGLQIAFEVQSESNAPPQRAQIGAFVQAAYGQLGSVPIALFATGEIATL